MEKFYTTEQVAEMLHVSVQTILKTYIPMGLAFIRITKRKFLFLESDIVQFVKKNREQKTILYR